MERGRSMVPNTKKTFQLTPLMIDYALNICHGSLRCQQLRGFASNIDFNGNTTLMINNTIEDLANVLINIYFKGDMLA